MSEAANGAAQAEAQNEAYVVNGVTMQPAIMACDGCERTVTVGDTMYCKSYPNPASKWRLGNCNFATHVKEDTKVDAKINPLKASKRAHRRK